MPDRPNDDATPSLFTLPNTSELKPLKRFMAFDFGTGRIGVAMGQTLTRTTTALAPLKARDGQPNWDLLTSLINEWQPDAFVVGLPVNMDGSASEMSQRATKFAKRLHGRFGRPFYLCDERLSSQEAKQHVRENQGEKNFGEFSVDGLAAQLILETFFAQLPREVE